MAKKRTASRGESSRRSGGDEATSRGGKTLKPSNRERALLANEIATRLYSNDVGMRELEMGRNVDFEWLENETFLELDSWLQTVGWDDFVKINEPVYPKLVRILYANLNPYTMVSRIGDTEVKLDVQTWCETFNIPPLELEEEEVRDISKEDLFLNLFHKPNLGLKQWINVGELPQDPTIRLAASVLMNIIIPKRGSKEQIREEEARVLYALKNGKDLNMARDVVDRIKQTTTRRNTPLCYPMHLMAIMRKAGINPSIAGDVEPITLKSGSLIGSKTLIRLGFKKDLSKWNYVGRGSAKAKFMGESYTAAGEGEDAEQEEARGAEETAAAAESSLPRPSTQARGRAPSPSTTPILHQLSSQISALSNQLAHTSSTLTEKLEYFTATINSRLDTMDSRLDDIHLQVRNCEIKLTSFQQPSTSPRPPSQPTPHPTPQPSPPFPQPSSSSPTFTLEELILSPTKPTPTQPPTQPPSVPSDPIPTLTPPHSTQTTPTPTLSILPHPLDPATSPPTRTKRAVSKPASKDFSRSFRKKPKPAS